jgi:ATP-binding cassette subfamily F protein 3
MSLLTTHNLSKYFGPDEIFSGVTVEIPHGARIALVGPNGAGKTTLLNILIGQETPTEGAVHIARNTRIGFLPQRPEMFGDLTVWEEALTAFTDLRQMEAELAELEEALADPARHDTAFPVYGELQERFEHLGGYSYEQRIRTVLHGVGFLPEDYQTPIARLSGGQKTRALLARLLLEAPDLLVLDEPTNHLDIAAVEWLESYLNEFPGAVLAVSHDRYFMDATARAVWEMDFGVVETYRGNYSHYARQREDRHARMLKEYEAQQEFLAKEEDYIRRNMAGQNTRQAKGRLKRLERLKKEGGVVRRPRQRQKMRLRMSATFRSGDKVVSTRSLDVGYADAQAPLFRAPDITLWRTEVAALIGPNGAGKTTFLKTILGQIPPLSGEVKIGAAVKIGYFAQAHELLDPKKTVLEEIQLVKEMPLSQARNYLALFLFQEDDVFRKVETLSGGERGRVALAKLALAGANFLLLDEPTNHLDIASQEILQNVLADFEGTILLVSHDRYLIDALATQIWAIEPGKLTVFEGTYKEYVAARTPPQANEVRPPPHVWEGEKKSPGAANGSSEKKHGLSPYKLQKRVAELESYIHELEAHLEDLTRAMASAGAESAAARVSTLGAEYMQTEADLQAALEEWAALAE